MIISTPNLNQVRKEIQLAKKKGGLVIVKAQDEEFNRKILEIPGVSVLLSPELHNRKDYLKQRDSGLNEHLCKLAKKNNIKIAINIEEISKLDKKLKARILARIKQNIELCKRTGCQIIIWPEGKHKKQDIMAFFLTLKGSTQLGKKAGG